MKEHIIDYSQITLRARKRAEDKVARIFGDSHIDLWLKSYQGGTYCKVELELKLSAERMFTYEYTAEALRRYLYRLHRENRRMGEKAGELKAGLKPWEINDYWQFSRVPSQNGWNSLFRNLVRLYTPLVAFLHGLCEFLLKTFLSFVIIISLMLILKKLSGGAGSTLDELKSIVQTWSYLSGIAIVHLLSAGIYNWYTSQEVSKPLANPVTQPQQSNRIFWIIPVPRVIRYIFPDKLALLLIFVWAIEGLLGYEIIARALDTASNPLGYIDRIFIMLSVSIFAFVNIFFAVSKAKRDCHLLERKEKLLALVEKRREVTQLIEFIMNIIGESDALFKEYKYEYTVLLNEKGGILSHASLLSRHSYSDVDVPAKMPLSKEEYNILEKGDLSKSSAT